MMRLPRLPYAGTKQKRQIVTFGGVRYGRGGGEGELAESLNLSSRQYPVISQRTGRAEAARYAAPTAIFGKGKLCVVDGTDFLYDGEAVGKVTAGEKQMVTINTKVIIWPDQKYYDTATGQFGELGLAREFAAEAVTFTTSTLTVSDDALAGETLEELFAINQAVEISGASIEGNNKTIIIREIAGNTLIFYKDTMTEGVSETAVTLARRVPELTVICASDNRVWGADETTIWACALGDPLTWYNYDGLSTDSYAVAVGTDGPFTGCCAFGSNVLFWKEDKLHKVLGNMPSEYQIYTYTVQGVQESSGKSMQVINEVLYYKGQEGVYAYTGSVPSLISENFGTRRFDSAVAGTDGQQYYLSMRDLSDGAWGLWVFDTMRGIWLREDETHALDFTNLDGDMLMLAAENGVVWKTGQEGEGGLSWMATFVPFDETTHGRKGYSRLYLRMELDPGAHMKVELREDLAPWRQAAILYGARQRTASVELRPGRCDSVQIRLTGKGRCAVKSLVREFDVGSEV